MTLTFGKKKLLEGLNFCINFEFNLLDHVGVVQKYMTGWTDGRSAGHPDGRMDEQPENIMLRSLRGGGIQIYVLSHLAQMSANLDFINNAMSFLTTSLCQT